LGFIYSGRIQGLTYHMVVHGYEATTEYEELLNERRFDYHFQNYATSLLHGFNKMFAYYKSSNICERKGFAKIHYKKTPTRVTL
jgi:hypothetical protein